MLVHDIVDIYSPTGAENNVVDFLVQWANRNGFRAHKDEIGNFIAEKGTGREVMMVGHVDTVPGEIQVREEDGRLYGRGAVDAKGALACFLEAAATAENNNVKIIVIGAVDEEGDSRGARNLLGKYHPEFIIIGEPSGWSNVNIGYKGRMNVYYQDDTSKEHTSSSNLNSYEAAIEFYNKLRNYSNEFNKGKSLFQQLGMKLTHIQSHDDAFNEHIELAINFRIPVGFELDGLRQFIDAHCDGARISYSLVEAPVKVEKTTKLIKAFMKAIRASGADIKFKLKSGTSDANILNDYHVPMVIYGPGDSNLDHTPNEWLDLEEYRKSIRVVEKVLAEI